MIVIALIGGLSLAVVLVVAKWCCHRLRGARRAAAHARTTAATVAGAYARVLRGHAPPPLHLPRPTHSPPKRWTRLRRPLVVGLTAATAVALAFTLVPAVAPGTGYVRINVAGPDPAPPTTPSATGPDRTPGPGEPTAPPDNPAPTVPTVPGGDGGSQPGGTAPAGGSETSTGAVIATTGSGSGGGLPVSDGSGGLAGGDPPTAASPPAEPPPAQTSPPPPPDDDGKDPLLACLGLLGLELCV